MLATGMCTSEFTDIHAVEANQLFKFVDVLVYLHLVLVKTLGGSRTTSRTAHFAHVRLPEFFLSSALSSGFPMKTLFAATRTARL